jgi:hypothetical protein
MRKLAMPTRKLPGDFGQIWVSESIALSRPDNLRNITRLFERQSTEKRRRNAYKASVSRMAQRFAARLLSRVQ